jgi:glycerol-3-phosphate cytidylyltransferase-like family protein
VCCTYSKEGWGIGEFVDMKTLVISSLYGNPLGQHHIDYLESASQLGTKHVVIVNNNTQVALKKSIPFQSTEERIRIIGALSCVNLAWRSIDLDSTVCKTIEWIYGLNCDKFDKIIFANGGNVKDCAEAELCRKLGIELVFGVGGNEKLGASSQLIERSAIEWVKRNQKKALSLIINEQTN